MIEKVDVLIIGASAAGFTAALTARKYNKNASIMVLRKEEATPVPCGIPYIFGTLFDVKKNCMPDGVLIKNNVKILTKEAKAINRDKKTVTLADNTEIGYEKLILCTGSTPVKPPIPGIDLKNVFFAQKDTDYLNDVLTRLGKVKDVVIIGGGFIGVEFADEFRKRGLNVTIVELLPRCLQLVFDEEYCIMAEEKLRERGVHVITKTRAEEIVGKEEVEKVRLSSGEEIKADIVLIGIGVRANTVLAQEAGLKIGEQKGIWVNEYMQTTDEDIFAAGDCAEKFSFFTGKPTGLKLASIACREARIAGVNIFGLKRKNPGVIGSFSTIIGDLGLGAAGLVEKAAKENGFDVITGQAVGMDKHPSAMPECRELKIKLIFDRKSGVVLGGEIAGGTTTAELTNIVSLMIERKMTMDEIATFQYGTHPAFTCSPVGYPIANAAEDAIVKM